MKVSVCCLTYGRVVQLQEALESWLRQDYSGHELVIYNTYTPQKLQFQHINVRIINTPSRPATLGETRNRAIKECRGEYILNLDDDDIILNWYVSWLVARSEGLDWVRQGSRFNMVKGKIESITEQATNQFMFKKSAWEKVGGYPHKNSGEDVEFRRKLAQHTHGREFPCPPPEIGFIYGWANGPFNISGFGPDQPQRSTGLQEAAKLVRKHSPRVGRVVLRPQWRKDYWLQTRKWLKENGHAT